MTFYDTHAHLYASEFDEDQTMMIQRALDAGVTKMLLPNIDLDSIEGLHKLCQDHSSHCFPMMGLHPCSVKEDYALQLDKIREKLFEAPEKYVAVGEIGTDLYWEQKYFESQNHAFLEQVSWAMELDKPIVVHVRNSMDETIDLLEGISHQPRGVFHCFSGTVEQGNKLIEMGFYLGIGGVLTFKNSGMAEIIGELPLSKMILETDAPYLTPAPHRGKRNESSYIPIIAEKLASVKNCNLQEIAEITSQNAKDLFHV